MTRQRAAALYLSGLVVLIPITIVPGIDEFALLPRLSVFLLATLVFSALSIFLPGEDRSVSREVHIALLAFWGILAASALWAHNPFRSTFDLAKHVPAFVLFLLLSRSLPASALPTVFTCHAATGLAVSLLGIAEYHGFTTLNIPSTGRPSATFAFRNLAGAYLATGVPLAFLAYPLGKTRLQKSLGVLGGGAMLLFLLYTRARASWVGLAAGGLCAACLWMWIPGRPSPRSIFISLLRSPVSAAVVLAVILGFLPDDLGESHTQRFDEKKSSVSTALASIVKPGGDRGRFGLWDGTLDMIADHPVAGVGLGNWEYVYPRYDRGRQIRAASSPHRPHNDILWIWSETGTVGLIAYLALLLALGRRAILALRHTHEGPDVAVVLSAVASMIAYLGVGMFSFPFERVPPEFHFWLGATLLFVGGPSLSTTSKPREKTLHTQWLIPILLVLALLITGRHILFDRHYTDAVTNYLRKDHAAAAASARKALEYGVFEPQALVILAEGAYHDGRWDDASNGFGRILDYNPNYANAYNGLGLAEYGRGNVEKAVEYYDRALELVPNHHIARYNKGLAFEKAGMVDSAIAAYRGSYRVEHPASLVNLAALYNKLGQPDSALAIYRRAATESTVPSPEAWYNLGSIYGQKRDFQLAGDAYSRFLQLWSKRDSVWTAARVGLAQAYSGYGVQLEMRGAVDSARMAYEKALEINPDEPVNWFNLGNVYRHVKAFQEAVEAYEKAIALDPQHLDSHNNLGMTYRDLGDDAKAIEIYQRAQEFAPDNATLNYNLGQALMATGRTAEGMEALNRFKATWDGDPVLVHYYMGNAYAQARQFERARAEYRTFLDRWQGDPAIRQSAEGILRSITPGGAP